MARRKSNARSKFNPEFEDFIANNPIPMQVHEYSQKKFSKFDMIHIKPLTRNQERFFDLWKDDYSILAIGSAGTGKSFVAIYLALQEILDPDSPYEKLLIVRSPTAVKSQGFLPGELDEKQAVFEKPYIQIFDEIFKKKNQYKFMKEAGLIEFGTTSYIRGTSYRNTIVIYDEFQSSTFHEIMSVCTRIAEYSKIILCGDGKQDDLIYSRNEVSGFQKFVAVSDLVPEFRKVNFTTEDIVRSGFVKSLLIANERYEEINKNKR